MVGFEHTHHTFSSLVPPNFHSTKKLFLDTFTNVELDIMLDVDVTAGVVPLIPHNKYALETEVS